ncbi:alpha/beta hydrolase family protein [Streptomyces sp. NPDC002454]
MTADRSQNVPTAQGEARIHWHRADRPERVLALGHGAGAGTATRDLLALAGELPRSGTTVALVEQPWRVAGKKLAPAPKSLDAAWRELWPVLVAEGPPVIAGGRSAGARVACRTAHALGARAVLALAFPLHPPGRPERSRAEELLGTGVPTLVVQGANDPFGRPDEFPDGPYDLVGVPHGDHSFAVAKRAPVTPEEAVRVLVDAVTAWLPRLR